MIDCPPVVWSAPPPQTMIELRLPANQVDWICRLLGASADAGKRVYGCASWQTGGCLVILPREDVACLREHEIAHCNGWPDSHPR